MEPFRVLTSQAVVLLRDNIDTDQIIPSRYTILTDKAEIAKGLFGNWKDEDPAFPLNDPHFQGRRVLMVGENFGCGSSREAAVWALVGHGFKAVCGRSFADIFRSNALKNGLLLVDLLPQTHGEIVSLLARHPDMAITIDLPAKTVLAGERSFPFSLDDFSRELLVEGQDELGYLLSRKAEIAQYEAARVSSALSTQTKPHPSVFC